MRAFIILALVGAAAADVSHLSRFQGGPEADAQITQQESDVRPDGFSNSFQTSNGISVQEKGVLKNAGREGEGISVEGRSTYTAPDGTPIQIMYIADENGYHPQGAHLPTSPPIPEAIQRARTYVLAHPPPLELQQRY